MAGIPVNSTSIGKDQRIRRRRFKLSNQGWLSKKLSQASSRQQAYCCQASIHQKFSMIHLCHPVGDSWIQGPSATAHHTDLLGDGKQKPWKDGKQRAFPTFPRHYDDDLFESVHEICCTWFLNPTLFFTTAMESEKNANSSSLASILLGLILNCFGGFFAEAEMPYCPANS